MIYPINILKQKVDERISNAVKLIRKAVHGQTLQDIIDSLLWQIEQSGGSIEETAELINNEINYVVMGNAAEHGYVAVDYYIHIGMTIFQHGELRICPLGPPSGFMIPRVINIVHYDEPLDGENYEITIDNWALLDENSDIKIAIEVKLPDNAVIKFKKRTLSAIGN